jgi:parvulin-like peptidyl-prolyl isomerase
VEKYFAAHQIDFDQVLLYKIAVPYRPLAQEVFYQIEEGEISFYDAAHLYDINPTRRSHCGYEGKFYRWSFKPDLSSAIFNAVPGKVIGPFEIEQECHLMMIEEFIPAELTPEHHQEILNRIFNEWLLTEMNYLLNSH